MSKFDGFEALTYTTIPNELLDTFMPVLGEAELKVALFIARKTFGWHKQDDDLSISQIAKGTGLSKPAVINATASLVERGLLIKRERGQNTPHNYRLNVQTSKDSLLDEDAPSKATLPVSPQTSKATLPELVNKVNTQKKLLKKGIKENASDANAPTPPPPDRPSKPKRTRTQTLAPAQGEAGPPSAPPVTPEQAAANDAAWQAVEAAPPEARQPMRASGTSKDAIERAIGDVCFRADRDLRRANMGDIRAWGKRIRETNADLETPITAELIYHVFEDSGYWQRHYMSLDEVTNTRRLPTPGIVGKHTLNILAWGKGQTQAPPPPLVRYTAPSSPEPIFRRRTPAELEALRRQALEGLPEANYARTA